MHFGHQDSFLRVVAQIEAQVAGYFLHWVVLGKNLAGNSFDLLIARKAD